MVPTMITGSQRSGGRHKTILTMLVSATTMAALLVACGNGGQGSNAANQDEDTAPTTSDSTAQPAEGGNELEQLVAEAQAEGTFTLYSGPSEALTHRVLEAFEEKYGIQGEFHRASSTDLFQRFAVEAEAGVFEADVILTSTHPKGFLGEVDDDWIDTVQESEMPIPDEFPSKFMQEETPILQIKPWGIGYNTDTVEDPPQDWADLVDPQWEGEIAVADPSGADAYFPLWYGLLTHEDYGEEFIQSLASHDLLWTDGASTSVQHVGAQEASVLIPTHALRMASSQAEGIPVALSQPEFTVALETYMVLTGEDVAENPAAARLFAYYLMTEEGNLVMSDQDEDGFSVYGKTPLPEDLAFIDMDEALDHKEEILDLLEVN